MSQVTCIIAIIESPIVLNFSQIFVDYSCSKAALGFRSSCKWCVAGKMVHQVIFESAKYVNSSDEIKNNKLYSEVVDIWFQRRKLCA